MPTQASAYTTCLMGRQEEFTLCAALWEAPIGHWPKRGPVLCAQSAQSSFMAMGEGGEQVETIRSVCSLLPAKVVLCSAKPCSVLQAGAQDTWGEHHSATHSGGENSGAKNWSCLKCWVTLLWLWGLLLPASALGFSQELWLLALNHCFSEKQTSNCSCAHSSFPGTGQLVPS